MPRLKTSCKKKVLMIEAGNEEISHQKQDYYLTKSL